MLVVLLVLLLSLWVCLLNGCVSVLIRVLVILLSHVRLYYCLGHVDFTCTGKEQWCSIQVLMYQKTLVALLSGQANNIHTHAHRDIHTHSKHCPSLLSNAYEHSFLGGGKRARKTLGDITTRMESKSKTRTWCCPTSQLTHTLRWSCILTRRMSQTLSHHLH